MQSQPNRYSEDSATQSKEEYEEYEYLRISFCGLGTVRKGHPPLTLRLRISTLIRVRTTLSNLSKRSITLFSCCTAGEVHSLSILISSVNYTFRSFLACFLEELEQSGNIGLVLQMREQDS